LKIKDITTKVKTIELKKAFITALRRVEKVEFVRVEIHLYNGNIGIGEAPSTKIITGEDSQNIVESIEKIKNELIGLDAKEALKKIDSLVMGSSAKAALNIGIYTLLFPFSITNKKQIKTDITISLNEENKMLKDAQEAYKSGMSILKIKLGKNISHAINITKILAHKLPHATLLIDANQAWSLQNSLEYVKAVEGLQIKLIEQPVIANDLESLKIITETTNIPILADESVFNLEDVKRVMESKSADMINIKLMKCGGVSKAIEILEYARKKNIICMLGSMLEGPYSINAALYLAFNYRDVIKYVDLDSPLLYKVASEELDFKFDGCTISYKG